MTEIEKQAEKYGYVEANKLLKFNENCHTHFTFSRADISKAFQDGAKWGMEHAIEWHDLRKRPADLPPKEKSYKNISKVVLNVGGDKVFYDYLDNKWKYYYSETEVEVTVWCKLPQYKDKE